MRELWRRSILSEDRTHHAILGRPLYAARFDEVLPFHEPGLAPARRGSRWFHIRPDGSAAYRQRFHRAFGFYEGKAVVESRGRWFHILPDGTRAYPGSFAWCGNFQQGHAVVLTRDGGYSHIDPDGSFVYRETYRYAGDFREGAAVVVGPQGDMWPIDSTGAAITTARFRDLGPFHKGLAPARDAQGWHHVDRAGRPCYGKRFLAVEPFYNGRARVVEKDGTIAVIDESGKRVLIVAAHRGRSSLKT